MLGADDQRRRSRSGRPRSPGWVASGVATTIRSPRARNQATTSSVGACATGTANSVPLLARTTLGLAQSVTGDAATTASTPAASAVRSIAPRLPGFSMPSTTSTRAGAGRSSASSAARRVRHQGQEAVGGVPVGDLVVRRPTQPDDLATGAGDPVEQPGALLGDQLGAAEERGRHRAGVQGQRQLVVTLDHRHAGLGAAAALVERHQRLEPGVAGAGDVEGLGHGANLRRGRGPAGRSLAG